MASSSQKCRQWFTSITAPLTRMPAIQAATKADKTADSPEHRAEKQHEARDAVFRQHPQVHAVSGVGEDHFGLPGPQTQRLSAGGFPRAVVGVEAHRIIILEPSLPQTDFEHVPDGGVGQEGGRRYRQGHRGEHQDT